MSWWIQVTQGEDKMYVSCIVRRWRSGFCCKEFFVQETVYPLMSSIRSLSPGFAKFPGSVEQEVGFAGGEMLP